MAVEQAAEDAAAAEVLELESGTGVSGYLGVYPIPNTGLWRAEARIDGDQHKVPGEFATVQAAALARARYMQPNIERATNDEDELDEGPIYMSDKQYFKCTRIGKGRNVYDVLAVELSGSKHTFKNCRRC